MTNTHLSQEEIAKYHEQGFLSPRRVFSVEESGSLRKALESIEQTAESNNEAAVRAFLPLTTRWAWDLVHDPRIVDPVSDVLGPDVMLWSMDWFIKDPGDRFVSYHQDATYWGLAPYHVATAWIALSDAGPATGPMKFIPGSHRGPLYAQEDTFAKDNMLSRGQVVKTTIDEATAIMVPLAVGEMSLHDIRIIHGSDPNTTDDRRIGMVLRYCATDVRQTKVDGDCAVLVKGTDNYGYFKHIERPQNDRGEKRNGARSRARPNPTTSAAFHGLRGTDR